MTGLFFDSSTLISMAVTCSLPILRKLKPSYSGEFYITDSVYKETIGRSMSSLRFRYEGHRLKELIEDDVIKVYPDKELFGQINWLMDSINSTYSTDRRPLQIVQLGEISTLVACIKEKGDSFAVDERIARLLVENSSALKPWLEHKMHARITISSDAANKWKTFISEKFIPVRSAELALSAWTKGILGNDKDVLFGLLWALKFAGCAITEDEINFYMKSDVSEF